MCWYGIHVVLVLPVIVLYAAASTSPAFSLGADSDERGDCEVKANQVARYVSNPTLLPVVGEYQHLPVGLPVHWHLTKNQALRTYVLYFEDFLTVRGSSRVF